jgi:F-type H+-transporting ATPase subunit epsilon
LIQQEYLMPATFRCTVITPSGPAFEGDASYVSFPAWDGQYGVMAGMAPLLGRLGEGPLHIEGDGNRTTMTLTDGFAHVRSDGLTLLTEHAEPTK